MASNFKEKVKWVIREPRWRKFLVVRTIGNFLVLFAWVGLSATFAPVVVEQVRYWYEQTTGVTYAVEEQPIVRKYTTATSSALKRVLAEDRTDIERLHPVSTEFGIVIPKIGANAKVVENVNAASSVEYLAALQEGVAHARGTGFPGGGEDGGSKPSLEYTKSSALNNRKIYLFAHSADNWWNINRYNAVFFLLKELDFGDEVDIFYQGRRYVYNVTQKHIVDPDQVHYLVEPSPEEMLVLQTCWPSGTTLKRLIVIAKPASQLSSR